MTNEKEPEKKPKKFWENKANKSECIQNLEGSVVFMKTFQEDPTQIYNEFINFSSKIKQMEIPSLLLPVEFSLERENESS